MRIWALIVMLVSGVTGAAVWASAADEGSSGVMLFDHQKMAAGFQKGGTFLDKGSYLLLTSHRVQDGAVEVHAHYGDIMYVVEGSATIVTGGTVVEPKQTAPDEMRGKASTGGKTNHLVVGDVLVIQAGTPHWFQKVDGVVNYFVVKPRMPEGPASAEVVHIDHQKMEAGFAGPVTTVMLDRKAYDVRAGHRTGPGEVETHAHYTDIMYITGGSATLITGGQVKGDKKDNPDEPRGKSITGGQTTHLVKGDVVVIPNGIPHWFEKVSDFTNFVVKVRDGN